MVIGGTEGSVAGEVTICAFDEPARGTRNLQELSDARVPMATYVRVESVRVETVRAER